MRGIGQLTNLQELFLANNQLNFNEVYPQMTSKYGFKCSFNPTFPAENQDQLGWISQGYYGLDQGPIVVMIENYRSEFLWRLMRRCPYLIEGLRRAGFTGGWPAQTVRLGVRA